MIEALSVYEIYVNFIINMNMIALKFDIELKTSNFNTNLQYSNIINLKRLHKPLAVLHIVCQQLRGSTNIYMGKYLVGVQTSYRHWRRKVIIGDCRGGNPEYFIAVVGGLDGVVERPILFLNNK